MSSPVFQKLAKPVQQIGRPKFLIAASLFVVFAFWLIAQVGNGAMGMALARLELTAQERVKLYRTTLETALNQLGHLPLVIGQHVSIINLLEGQQNLSDVRQYLSTASAASGAAVIYLLDTKGNTVASSNWSIPESFEGRNYGFRPYFQDAMEGREGRFFAVGVTTDRAGYFIARPVFSKGIHARILGVIVVKVELENLQATWQEGGEVVMVTNEDGIIVFASTDDWRYSTIKPLSDDVKQRIKKNRTFVKRPLNELTLDKVPMGNREALSIDGTEFLNVQAKLTKPNWTIHYLAKTQSVRITRWIAMSFLAGGLLFSVVALLYWREKSRKRALQREADEAKRIRQINTKLTEEITVRKRAEADLQAAQEELVLASKMAALGRMSAAIAHEVNQPIAAIKTFSSSGKLLLERGKYDETAQALTDIGEVTDRLSTITGDLKLFARTSNAQSEDVVISHVLDKVLKTFTPTFEAANVKIALSPCSPKSVVHASEHRLQQVMSNILTNALDAMSLTEKSMTIEISLIEDGDQAVVRFTDSGPGIDEDVLDKVFDPFVTTKPVEQGVGLGLAISYGLVEEMGGTLRARNSEEGGAIFSLRLPLAVPTTDIMKAAE